MPLKRLFRGAVVAGYIAFAAYWFLPYTYTFWAPEESSLLSYSGYGASLQLPNIVGNFIFAVWTILALGLFYFYRIARSGLIAFILINFLLIPFNGVSVETGVGSLLLGVTQVLDGVIMAMAFYSPLADEFR